MKPLQNLVKLFVCALLLAFAPALASSFGEARAQAVLGPETLVRGANNKTVFHRTFNVADTSRPYTLTIINGNSDGSARPRLGVVVLNGQKIVTKQSFKETFAGIRVAIRPQVQNQLKIKIKGGPANSFVIVRIEPSEANLLEDPTSPDIDDRQAGLATPFNVSVCQATNRAYVSDRFRDAVFEFDIDDRRLTRRFDDLDGDQTFGNGGMAGVSMGSAENRLVAVSSGEFRPGESPFGTIAVVDLNDVSQQVTQLFNGDTPLNPFSVALNANNGIAAFQVLFNGSRRAYFFNTETGELNSRATDERLTVVAGNSLTSEFVFGTSDGGSAPSLIVFSAQAPFQRLRRIGSTAPAGTAFEAIAINEGNNTALAVNQTESAAYLFDLANGRQLARFPLRLGNGDDRAVSAAINPDTNMAVITSRFTNFVTVINLSTRLVSAELPLPAGVRPNGVDVARGTNLAVIAENGFASSSRNGSILLLRLPEF